MDNGSKLSKGYLVAVLVLTLIFPAVFIYIESFLINVPISLSLIGKWFIFSAVGLRLFSAGIRQITNPAFTAQSIFNIKNEESFILVKELGFANLCAGLVGIISLFIPHWRIVCAFSSGLFYGIAGFNHIRQKGGGPNEKIALYSDVFIFLALLAYVVLSYLQIIA
jgi:uncharacterized protein DUF6790